MKCLWFFVFVLALATAFSASGESFRVGYAEADITPEHPMPMGGYSARGETLSEGVRDPLYAKALVIEAEDVRLAVVGLDLNRPPMDDSMDSIFERARALGVDHVMVSASHTHHSPLIVLRDEPGMGRERFEPGVLGYSAFLEEAILDAMREAVDNLQDARIGWATQDIDMNRNRHSDHEPKPRDPELAVVRFDAMTGDPIAIMVNYAAHPTMHPVDDLRLSAEWPGEMMAAVESVMDTNCLFIQGAAGDLSVRTTPETDTIETYGQALAQKVIGLAEGIETSPPAAPHIEAVMERHEFASRIPVDNEELLDAYRQAWFPEFVNSMLPEFEGNKIRPTLTVALLNNEVALVGGSGEFFSAHSIRLKERFRGELTLFVGYCNGSQFYFPTIEGAAEGGYGGSPQVAWIEVGASERLINDALITLYEMSEELP